MDTFKLEVIEDRSGILLAVSQVLDALGSSRIDPRRAGLFLYGIQLASQNVDRDDRVHSSSPVESVTQTRDGTNLAPEHFVCNLPASRCLSCDSHDRCPLIPDEDDEDEEEDEDETENEDETEAAGEDGEVGEDGEQQQCEGENP
jgi:hypothetical protein